MITTTTAAAADEDTGSSNNGNSSTESNEANEAANSNESALNTSTGSNSSGVSSNSSNAPGSSNNGANGSGDANGAGGSGSGGAGGGGGGVHMKEQLIYLSKLLEFEVSSVEIWTNKQLLITMWTLQVNFSDYPKGNHNEFLTIVTLSTNPPQICHGVGKSCEESQNAAARNALKILSELGLNNAKK